MIRLLICVLAGIALAAGLVALGERGWGPVVVTHEGEQHRVTGPGERRVVYAVPGLGWRVPLLSDNVRIDTRWQFHDSRASLFETSDGERPEIGCFAIWRFRDAASAIDPADAGARVEAALRETLRSLALDRTLEELLASDRVEVETTLEEHVREILVSAGMEVRAAGIQEVELSGAVRAMVARQAEQARSLEREADQEPARMRAEADGEARRLRAAAARDAEIRRGQGEAEAARIYAEAHAVAPDFYAFQRHLEAYRKTIGANTTLVLSPDSDFFRLLQEGGTPRQ